VNATLVSPNPAYSVTAPTNRSLNIATEDANVAWSGATTLTLSNGTVPLTAMVTDMADGYRGDVRNAKVQFVDRSTGTVLGTAVVVPIGDGTTGTATLNWAATPKAYTIGFVVLNYYTRNNALDNVNITVK